MDHCDECEFHYNDLAPTAVAPTIEFLARDYHQRLTAQASPALLRAHPIAATWSALEYACHHRDTLRLQRERIQRALVEDCPEFSPMGRDERVWRDRYNEQEPSKLAVELVEAADEIAAQFTSLELHQWQRTCIYTWPTRAERTIAWVGRHTVHEGIHHLRDIDRVLGAGASKNT